MLKERDRENSESLKAEYIDKLNRHETMLYEGSKGGEEKPHTPYETPNNLLSIAYAKVLVAVGEGEFAGRPTGRDIYLNGTPLINAAGEENFGGVTWEWRPGTVDQTYIQGNPEASNEISVGTEVTQLAPWVQQVTKSQLSSVRVTLQFPALMQQLENGDTVGYTVDYAIDLSVNGGPFALYQQYQVSGKTNSVYERTHTVPLPESDNGWTIRVRRITANSQSNLIQDKMNIKSYAEVVDAKQRYPNTALLFVQFDSRLFGGGTIPKISVNTEGRVVRIPSNYDPEQRTYTGVWDGSFKWGWTDNPAWVFFDIVTQDRFGLGSRVTTNQVDKWELYEVAQHCDVMLDDGTGSGKLVPRHTCNMYIQSKADAWNVLRDICSIFNGMTYWNGTQFVAIADKLEPVDNIPLFNRANVVDGQFNYTATDERTIFTSALISYDEPEDHFNTQVEAVWERSEILRWGGDRQTTLSAIGCTSRSEAQRKGKYTLLTNMYNRTVTFKTGLQGLSNGIKPGGIIGVADPLIAGKSFTGRILASTPTVITLDRPTEAKAGDVLFVTLKDGNQQGRTVKASVGNIVTLTTAYSETLMKDTTWYLESADLKSQLFKVVKLTSPDESIYEITAVEYNTSKYAAIDNGARLEPRPVSKVPPQAQKKPEPVTITSNTFIEQTMAVTTMTITWPQTENAVLYEGQWRVGQGDWVDLGTTGALEFNVRGIYTGKYLARVRAINALGIKSQWALSATTDLDGKAGLPAALASLTVTPLIFGMRLNWAFPNGVEDTARTEVMYSKTPSFAQAIKLGDFAYPQNTHDINGLAAGTTFYFWARLVDRTGNVGPYFPLTNQNGVQGKVSTNVAEYEEYFKDQITESALGQQLAEKIDKIEVIEGDVSHLGDEIVRIDGDITRIDVEVDEVKVDVSGLHKDLDKLDGNLNWLESQLGGIENQLQNDITTVNKLLGDAIEQTNNEVQDLLDDVADLNTTVEGLQDQVNAFVDALEYDPSKSYKKGDSVRQGQKLYQAIIDVPVGQAPPNTTYWKDVGDIITDLGALASQVSTNSTTITQQGNTITAQGQKLDAIEVRVGSAETKIAGNASAITNLQSTVTQQGNNITTNSQAITALKGSVTNLETGQAGNASAIESLRTTVTQQGGVITSQGQQLTSLTAEVNALQTDVDGVQSELQAQGTAITGLTTTVTQQGGMIQANSNNITSLQGRVDGVVTDLSGLTTKVNANTTAVSNLTTTVTQQGADIASQARDITTLKADVTSVTTDVNGLKTTVIGQGTAISNLETKVTKQGNDITAISSDITKLTADLHLNALDDLYDKAETDQQISDALNIASGAASATQSLTAEVTKQGDTITAQGQLLTELNASLTDIDGNIVGVGSAIESLKTTVTSQGNTITSQGQSITQLSNSLTLVDGKATDANNKADSALAQVVTKAEASAVTALTTRVTNAEGKITSQGSLITELNNSLTITNGNVTAAKDAADKAQTDATNALTQLVTKADASAVTQLETRVTSAEGKITSQGVSITQLNNSLVTTNQNVTAAQQAAQAASDKAGAKGEVIYGTSAPAVDKRLPQNLWIDTTNNANTPKRWNGTDWVAVTDKVATDAAAAAADALSKVATKAESSALQALSNTVTQQGTTISAQGQSITNLTASLKVTDDKVNLKADASAVQALTNTVTQQGLDITANNSAITNLKTTVEFNALEALYDGAETDQQIADAFNIATGAASATQELKSSVDRIDGVITAQAESITELKASLEGSDVAALSSAVQTLKVTVEQQGNTISSQGQSITQLNNSLTITDGKATDALGKANSALSQVATKAEASAVTALTTRVSSVEGTVTSQGTLITTLNNNLTITNTNVTAAQQAAQAASDKAGAKGEVIYSNTAPATDKRLPQNLWIDTTGNANTPKRWDGNAWVAVTDKVATDAAAAAASALTQVSTKAEASAVQTLTNRVTSVEGTVVTQGQAITNLNNSITRVEGKADDALQQITTKADASAVNSLTTRVTDAEGKITSQGQSITELNNNLVITNGNVTTAQQAAQAASDKAGAKGEVIYGSTAPVSAKQLAQNLWIDTTGGANTPKRWTGSAWVEVTDKVAKDAAAAAADALAKVALKADASVVQALSSTVESQGNAITANAAAVTKLNTTVQFKELDELYTDENGAQIAEALNIASGAASANESLKAEVTQQGDKLTAQAIQITDLSSSLSDIDGNIVGQGSAIANLKTVTTAQGNTISTMGQSITQLNNSLTVTDGKANTALANANSALTQVSTKAEASAVTSLTNRVTSVEGTITSQGQSITQLNNSLTIVTGKADDALEQITHKADSSVVDNLTSTVTQQGNTLTAQATQITGLTTKVDNNTAAVQTISNATATLTDSVANMQTSVQAIASGLRDDDGSGDLSDALQAWNSAAKYSSDIRVLATETEAVVSKTDTLEVSVGEANASVQVLAKAQADADGKASASWSVKLQVNSQGQYVAAGIGLGIENGPAGLQSSFLVSADRFAVVNGLDANLSVPFVVEGGQVFIKDAFIANGSITMLKIGDALQSDDYVEGVQGWRLLKSGSFEINGSVAGQGRMSMTNRSLRVYDAGGNKRVQLGDLEE